MVETKGKKGDAQPSNEDSRMQTEMAAYYRWLNRGCPVGDDMSDWVEAEKEMSQKAKSSKDKKKN